MNEREELIALVRRIVGCEGTEEAIEAWLDELQSRVPHPAVTDLIYHHEPELTPEEVVDVALAYRAVPLSSP
jgi:hypothetical protein